MKEEIDFSFVTQSPVVFLEGGLGLLEEAERLVQMLVNHRIYPFVFEELYDNPELLITLKWIKPKTIVLGTTGVYRDKIDHCVKMFKIAEHIPDNVIFLFGEDDMKKEIKEFKALKPSMKVFAIHVLDDEDYRLTEIK